MASKPPDPRDAAPRNPAGDPDPRERPAAGVERRITEALPAQSDGAPSPRASAPSPRASAPDGEPQTDELTEQVFEAPRAPGSTSERPERRPTTREFERGARLNRYVILRSVGQGGMGIVYAAYDPELDRKVALKLLRPDAGDASTVSEGRARLLREAQAMARVSHPNVCAIFDVGMLDDQVFMAMELVEGTDLSHWLRAKERTWRDILRVFMEAGQGLAAAHSVGLVHRDFKGANVLLGKDGRARVTDFGLARRVVSNTRDLEPSISFEAFARTTGDSAVTQLGVVVGTPQYMPPEQYLGNVPDARSDQFSFCAALYWALYGKRPFDPAQVAEAARQMRQSPPPPAGGGTVSLPRAQSVSVPIAGVIQEPPPGTKVPAGVRRALMRGLSLRSAERYPSMDELLQELEKAQRQVQRRGSLVVAGVALGIAVAAGGVYLYRQAQVCAGADTRLAQVWNAGAKQKLEAAFSATGKPYAQAVGQSIGRVLDAYARDWIRQSTEACVATRVNGTQTEALLSLRTVCLERRRKDFELVVQAFTEANERVVTQAVEAVNALPALADCGDLESLSHQVDLPTDPMLRAQIAQLGEQLSTIESRARAGQYEEVLKAARALEPRVEATGYLPLRAELRGVMGWNQHRLGDSEAGLRLIEQAMEDADAARADRLRIKMLSLLVFVNGVQGREELAARWARQAEAALQRIGGDPHFEITLAANRGSAALLEGRYRDAQRFFETALGLQRKVFQPSDPRISILTYNLGHTVLAQGEPRRAATLLKDALEHMKASLGGKHPNVALCHSTLAWAYRDSGDFERALEHAEEAVSIQRVLFGESHPEVADALDAVGMTLIKLQRYGDAQKTFESALAIKEKALGADSEELSYSYDGIGQALLAAGRAEEAVRPLEKALSYSQVGPEPLAESGFALAQALWATGKHRPRALTVAAQARERFAQLHKQARLAEVDKWLVDRGVKPAGLVVPAKASAK
ncbi:MAG TPA: tetratricopeptide repeat protein [Longimicrobium sp.]|nr:tetratricopeptide repeat protein [Longimicrobium sp.]